MLSFKNMQEITSFVLLIGTTLSAVFVIVGGLLYLIQFGNQPTQFEWFTSGAYQFSIKEIGQLFLSFSSLNLIELGLILLVLTQALRLFLILFFYAVTGDMQYTFISFFILMVLLYSLVLRQ